MPAFVDVVTTPNWQCLRGGSESFLGQNEFDHHLSYVSAGQFRRRGYRVYGAGFGNPRALSVKFFAHAVRLFGVRDFSMFDSLSKNMLSLAHTVVAVKDHLVLP